MWNKINIDSEEVPFKENVHHFLITCDGIDKSNICRVLSSQVRQLQVESNDGLKQEYLESCF